MPGKLVIQDNFLQFPDEVRQYGLGLKYRTRDLDEGFEGWRSENIGDIDPEYYNAMVERFIQLYVPAWLLASGYRYKADLFFHINSYKDMDDPVYKDWNNRIHLDDSVLSAVVYLNPDPPPGTGTRFYNAKDPKAVDMVVSNQYNRAVLFSGKTMLHCFESFFGSDLSDSRMVMLLFVRELELFSPSDYNIPYDERISE